MNYDNLIPKINFNKSISNHKNLLNDNIHSNVLVIELGL